MISFFNLIAEMAPFLLFGFFLAGLLHAFVPGGYYTRFLSRPTVGSVVNAAIFGIPLPLCSCGVIPTAMSLRKEGASKGATTSFLVATPQTGVDSIIATYSLMGCPFAFIRPIAALVTAVFGGCLVNFTSQKEQTENSFNYSSCANDSCCKSLSFSQKIKEALRYAFVDMMADIGKWLVVGLLVAVVITVFVPDEFFYIFQGNTFASMLLVLCLAVPMYLCATGSIPVAVALMLKGLTPGAALVLLMAGPACNVASMLVVKKVLGFRTLVTYLFSIVVGAVAFGCLVDYLQFNGIVNFLGSLVQTHACCAVEGRSWFAYTCAIVLFLLLVNSLVLLKFNLGFGRATNNKPATEENHATNKETDSIIYRVEGMNCNHCRASAENALRIVPGVTNVIVSLETKEARVTGSATYEQLASALDAIGFELHKI